MKKLLGLIIAAVIVAGGIWYVTTQNSGKQITVLSWDYYIGPDTIADFEKETGATVTYELIKSNEEALARIKANPGVYDIAVVGDYMVDIMLKEKNLERIGKADIANLKNIGQAFTGNYFDPTDSVSVPYAFGTTGFAVNTKFHTGASISWTELAKPEYKGKVAVMDDMRFVLGSVLMELGYSPNSVNQEEIDKAVALLKTVVPNIVKFSSDSPVELMVAEGATVAYAWSGDSLQMKAENEAIEYIIPSFGSLKFLDNMVIPTGAPHKDVAHEWINFILRPDVSAAITDEVQYGNPNTAAFELIGEETRTSAAVFPAADSLAILQYIEDVGDNVALYDTAWESVKE